MKCEICGKEILRDSQCINYKYYHNDCIENLQQENKKYKEVIDKLRECIKNFLCTEEYINVNGIAIADNYSEVLDILKEVSKCNK
jgi:hypothetical protein